MFQEYVATYNFMTFIKFFWHHSQLRSLHDYSVGFMDVRIM